MNKKHRRGIRWFGFARATDWMAIACLLTLVSTNSAQARERRQTTEQLGTMTLQEANRMLRRDILSILEPAERIVPINRRQVRDVDLTTRSVGTEFEGICRRDLVRLKYAPEKEGEPYEKAQLRPYAIEAWRTFHIVRLPKIDAKVGSSTLIWQQECTDVDRKWREREGADPDDAWDRAIWFPAPDAFHAVQAGFVLDMALAAVKAGTLKAQPCEHVVSSEVQSCEAAILKAGGVLDIGGVTSCPAKAGAICYSIDFLRSGTELTIVARGDDDNLRPSDILSISVTGFVTLG